MSNADKRQNDTDTQSAETDPHHHPESELVGTDAGEANKPVIDGGLNDETAARFVQGVLDAADPALTADERQKLGAVVEYLRGDEQTGANGGGN